MTVRVCRGLLRMLFVSLMLAACGGGDAPPTPPDVDAGDLDAGNADAGDVEAGPRDAGTADGSVEVDLGPCPDVDGDGHGALPCGDDCDDHDAARHPGATEECNLIDEDCNDATYGADADHDGFESSACCNGAGNCGTDCDDGLSTVNPTAAEVCDSIDDDCDGAVDEAVCVPCRAGYAGFDGNCTDVNECDVSGFCVAGTCSNLPGTFSCLCRAGYFAASSTGALCEDVDECVGPSNPCGSVGTCTNTPGSYTCRCPAGYAPGAGGCVNVDECASGAACGVAATLCTDTPGSYICTCVAGYTAPVLGGSCADLDECAAGACGAGATGCVNSVGSYACTCGVGYSGPVTGGTCGNVNECLVGTTCGATRAGCTDTVGSYACTCNGGYAAPATGGVCADVNECTAGTPCGAGRGSCTNTTGSYACACSAGYTAPVAGGTCADVNECAAGTPCGAGATCANTAGSYACTCPSGYSAPASGGTCADVDECAVAATCGTARASCTNTVGSYVCGCNAGYGAPATGGACADVNECAAGTPCGAGLGTCANTVGGYTCVCNAGYSGPATGGTCSDINECVGMPADRCWNNGALGLDACVNTQGGYACVCPAHYAGTGEFPGDCHPRFVVVGDGTVRDDLTGRVWQQGSSAGYQTQAASVSYCATLPLSGGGWRLPTKDQLLEIVDTRFYPTIDPTPFPGTTTYPYWSSTSVAGSSPPDGWIASYAMGMAGQTSVANIYLARCVRP